MAALEEAVQAHEERIVLGRRGKEIGKKSMRREIRHAEAGSANAAHATVRTTLKCQRCNEEQTIDTTYGNILK